MSKRFYLSGLALGLLYLGIASAQYPIMDSIADKIIQKYQTSTCEQLYQQKAAKAPPGPGGAEGHTDAQRRSPDARGIY